MREDAIRQKNILKAEKEKERQKIREARQIEIK